MFWLLNIIYYIFIYSHWSLPTCVRFWSHVSNSTLHHHHHQKTKWLNMFWKNAAHPSNRVSHTLQIYIKECWRSSRNNLIDTMHAGIHFYLCHLSACFTLCETFKHKTLGLDRLFHSNASFYTHIFIAHSDIWHANYKHNSFTLQNVPTIIFSFISGFTSSSYSS